MPKTLQEETESQLQFIVRNPQVLEIPLQMTGQPGIYKMPKDVWVGAKGVLTKVPYSWWPPEEYKNFRIGRFDLYPDQYVQWSREEVLKFVEEN